MLHTNTKDLTGQTFNRLTVIGLAGYFPHSPRSRKLEANWFAECSCDKTIMVPGHSLKSGNTKSCGCHKKEVLTPDMAGQRFGRLVALREVDNSAYKSTAAMWECRCDCGNVIVTQGGALRSGHTTSCGCYARETTSERATIHGKSHDRLYKIWIDIKTRCNNPNCKSYLHYGGRGITYAPEWSDFQSFYDFAMSHGYNDDLTIDRIDVNKGYFPGNVRFVSLQEQTRNKRNSIHLTYQGITKTLGQWAAQFDVNRGTAWFRYKDNLSFEEIFNI